MLTASDISRWRFVVPSFGQAAEPTIKKKKIQKSPNHNTQYLKWWSKVKPGPNDSNISTQHIPTMLVQHSQAPAKRSQNLNATFRNIVGRNMLHAADAFDHPVTTCSKLKIDLVRMHRSNIVARTWPNDYIIMQHLQMLHEKVDHFQIWANNTQHVATHRNRVAKRTEHVATNNIAICCVEMLRSFPGAKGRLYFARVVANWATRLISRGALD